MRSNLQEFDVRVTSNKNDNDNIGYLISSPGWLVDRGRIVAEKNGVGLYVLGNTVGDLANGGYAENNDVNIMIGDPYTGGSVMVSDRAAKGPLFRDVRGSVPTGFKLHDYTAEGTSYANLILTSGKNITFDNVWIEVGKSATGHSIIYGGGYDSVYHLPCLFDSDRRGRCVAPSGGKITFLNLRHIGGYISSDRRSNEWDGLTFSQNFDGYLELATLVEASDIDPSAGTDRRVFNFHPGATGVVDLSRTRTPANILPPLYPYVKHDGTRYLRRTNNGRDHRNNEGVIFAADARGTSGRSSKIYVPCGADANMGSCWNLARISYYAYSNPSNTGCTFTPRQGRARAESAEAIGAFGFTVGSQASNDVTSFNAGVTVQVMEPIRSSNLLYLRANDTNQSRALTCDGNADPGVFEIHLIPRLDR